MLKLLLLLLLCFASDATAKHKKDKSSHAQGPSFVTYDFSGGRFGDNLVAYIHGKWISYKYGLPLLYRPFSYSDQLVLNQMESTTAPSFAKYASVFRDGALKIKQHNSALYTVPYFPEFVLEQTLLLTDRGKPYSSFVVDWNDAGFRHILRQIIQPKKPLALIEIPSGVLSVAMHIRTGGSFEFTLSQFPSKAPGDRFYFKGLRIIHETFNFQPMYVHIFTDDEKPEQLADRFKKEFTNSNIVFGYRQENAHNANVLEDFFSFWLFDCLIRPDSHYSYIPGKLHDYKMVISPDTVIRHGKYFSVNKLKIEYLDGSTRSCAL